VCDPCGKKFSSKGSYENHVGTRKHRDTVSASSSPKTEGATKVSINRGPLGPADGAVYKDDVGRAGSSSAQGKKAATAAAAAAPAAAAGDDAVMAVLEGETEEEAVERYLAAVPRLTENDSLFEHGVKYATVEEALADAARRFSFFVPDVEYVVDLKALYMYFADKLAVGRTCLFCNHQFQSLSAVRQHMINKGHTKLPEDDKAGELDDFYDYTSSYPEGSADPATEEGQLALATDVGILPPGAFRKPVDIVDAGYTMVLSDGTRIGHRALARLYRQNPRYRGEGDRAQREARKQRIYDMQQQYKLLGMGGKDVANIGRSEVSFKQARNYQHWNMRNGQNTNLLIRRYFRLANPM
jgi:pre-60S factor REI1